MTADDTIIIVTGVAGSGKTTIGVALAQCLGCPFYDADDFHPPSNIAKMARGEPLDDADRLPWLERLHQLLCRLKEENQSAVLACSALKEIYRRRLAAGLDGVFYVYLHGPFDLIFSRLQEREGHYMSAAMLQSQFEALEPPARGEALYANVDAPIDDIIARIVAHLPNPGEPQPPAR